MQKQQKVALITGGAQRIGAEIARQLHQQGFNLVIHYRHSKEPAERLKIDLERKRPHSILLLQADLLEQTALDELVKQATQWSGRLDALINNASSFYPTPMEQANEEQWNDLMGSNLKAPFFLSQAVAPWLKKTQGCIVNLVDIHAKRPLKDHPIYAMAKAGNAMMVKTLARELGPEIRVNGVAPGAILWPEMGMTDETQVDILSRTALKRAGEPQDIAKTVVFLVMDAAYITGQIIAVDGGRSVQH